VKGRYAIRTTYYIPCLWTPWEDPIREWLRREDFRVALPRLLSGTDEQFCEYIQRHAEKEALRSVTPGASMQ
jgi:hypothetical protein